MSRIAGPPRLAALLFFLTVGSAGPGCAPAPEDTLAIEQQSGALVSTLPEVYPANFADDGTNVYLQTQIGTQYGIFRVPIGAGSPVLLDALGVDRSAAFLQVVGADLYYQMTIYSAGSKQYDLRRVAAGSKTPVKVLDLPFSAYPVVSAAEVYLQKSVGTDGRYQTIYRLPRTAGAVPALITAAAQDSSRDLVVAGGRLFWRSGWAGLSNNSLHVTSYDPATGALSQLALGTGRIEIEHLLVDAGKLYVFGDGYRLWSVDNVTGTATELPSLRTRMTTAGLSFCGDNYPYGSSSSAVKAGSFFAYCQSLDYKKLELRRFPLSGGASTLIASVPGPCEWYLHATASDLVWLDVARGPNSAIFKSAHIP